MLKILRRKPRAPMTPRQRYKNDLANLFGCGMMAMLGVCLAAVAIKAAIEEGLPTVADWVFLVLVVIGCIVLTYVGLRAARVIGKGLMEHAPVDRELELVPLGLRARPKLKMAATVGTAAITGVALFLGGLVAAGLIIEAAAGIDDLRTEPGIWITFGVSWTAALLGSFACYRMARSMLFIYQFAPIGIRRNG